MDAFAEPISWIFVTVNSGRVLSYGPQLYTAWRCNDGARSISMATWLYFAVAHLTGALYSFAVVHDPNLAAVFIGNCAACTALLLVVAWKRWQVSANTSRSARRVAAIAAIDSGSAVELRRDGCQL